MNRVVYCNDAAYNNAIPIKIMWMPTQIKKHRPCHFVPLLKVVRKDIHKKHLNVKKLFLTYINDMCFFFICSHVKLLALTKAVERVAAKSQSEDSDVKILEEENEEHGEEEEKTVVHKTCG